MSDIRGRKSPSEALTKPGPGTYSLWVNSQGLVGEAKVPCLLAEGTSISLPRQQLVTI